MSRRASTLAQLAALLVFRWGWAMVLVAVLACSGCGSVATEQQREKKISSA